MTEKEGWFSKIKHNFKQYAVSVATFISAAAPTVGQAKEAVSAIDNDGPTTEISATPKRKNDSTEKRSPESIVIDGGFVERGSYNIENKTIKLNMVKFGKRTLKLMRGQIISPY